MASWRLCRSQAPGLSTSPRRRQHPVRTQGSSRNLCKPLIQRVESRVDLVHARASRSSVQVHCVVASPAQETPQAASRNCADIALRYFECFNRRDIPAMLALMSLSCRHEGLAYPRTLEGLAEVGSFYHTFMDGFPEDISLVVDDLTTGDAHACGLIWHLELSGRELPLGRGMTFVRLDGKGRIDLIRESPEHLVKLTRAALPALGLAAPLFSRLAPVLQPHVAVQVGDAGPMGRNWRRAKGEATGSEAATAKIAAETASLMAERDSLRAQLLELQAGHEEREAAKPAESHPADMSSGPEASAQDLAPPQPTPPAAEDTAQPRATAGNNLRPATAPSSPAPSAEKGAPAMHKLAAATEEQDCGGLVAGPTEPIKMKRLRAGAGPKQSQMAPIEALAHNPGPEPNAMPVAQSAAKKPPGDTSASDLRPALSGVWVKDTEASDTAGYERATRLMQLNTLQRTTALRFIEGLEVEYVAGQCMSVHFLTVVPFFKVTEKFRVGTPTHMQRRDLKRGQQTGIMVEEPGAVCLTCAWGAPNAGQVVEVFSCPAPDVLHLHSTVTVAAGTAATLQVYRRSDRWKPQNKFDAPSFGR